MLYSSVIVHHAHRPIAMRGDFVGDVVRADQRAAGIPSREDGRAVGFKMTQAPAHRKEKWERGVQVEHHGQISLQERLVSRPRALMGGQLTGGQSNVSAAARQV